MAFNFLGTFSEEEVQALLSFAEDQLEDVEDRISYLRSNIERVGWIVFERGDDGKPVSYDIQPPNSLLAKYVRTYQFFGGEVLELDIRSRGEWLSFTKGEPNLDDDAEFQGGQVDGQGVSENYAAPNRHYDDAVEAATVAKVKDWVTPAIQGKREEWEYRIKRSIDLVDQYLEEIILLVQRSSGAETLDDLRSKIEFYLSSDEFVGAGRKNPHEG